MLSKRKPILLAALMASGVALAQPQIRTTRPDTTATVERDLAEGKALVSVSDAKKEPVLGLTTGDFGVTRAGETGRIVSVEPITQSVDVPRHLVLVVDNSYSMNERKFFAKMLGEVRAVTKTIRPVDDAQMVVLSDKKTVKMGGRNLHVDVLKSSSPAELDKFAAAACSSAGETDNTYLYEEIYAGLEILKGTPSDGPRALWIFTDGEELNSAFKGDVVNQAAQGVQNLRVYAVDYMATPKVNEFLDKLAGPGGAKKSGAAGDLLTAFQKSGSKTLHRYAVAYEFPPPVAKAAPAPPAKMMTFSAAALFDFGKAVLKPEGMASLKANRENVMADMSRADKVKITGYTDSIGSAEANQKLSLKRAEAVRDYLVGLGADASKMEVRGEGMANPIADNKTAAGRAKNRRVEVEVVGLGK